MLLQILNGANVSELVPAGSIYGLDANKSVEISIPGGAVGGPVSVRRLWIKYRRIDDRRSPQLNSTLFICTGTISMWSAVLVMRPTTLTTLLSGML